MSISHTLYLDICYFFYSFFPIGITFLSGKLSQKNSENPFEILGKWTIAANYMIIPYYLYYGGRVSIVYGSVLYMSIIIILAVFFSVGLEVVVIFFLTKKMEFRHFFKKIDVGMILSLIQIVVFEEIIFRSILLTIVWKYTQSYPITLFITSFAYALNHCFFGLWSCITKFWWGIILCSVLWYTRNFVLICVIHIINDLIIIVLNRFFDPKRTEGEGL